MNANCLVAAMVLGLSALSLEAQSIPILTLDQALSEAADSGDDRKLVSMAFGVAQLQRELDIARQGLSLTATGGYTAAISPSDDSTSAEQTLVGKAETASAGSSLSSYAGLAHSLQGSLSLSLPLTKVSLSSTWILPPPSSAGSAATTVALTVSQSIWDGYAGGQFRGTLEKSRLTALGKEIIATQGTSAAVLRVKQEYLTMLAAQRDLDIKQQVLGKQSQLLVQLQTIYRMKQASAIDLKTAEINARSAEIDVATAGKTLRLANERLAGMVGRPPMERFSVSEVQDPQLPAGSIEEAIRIGLGKRGDLSQYELSAKASRIDAALARAQGRPGVSLTGGAGLARSWVDLPLTAAALSLGGKITLPLLDSGAADLQARTNEGQALLYDLQADQLRRTIAADIRDYYETAELLKEKIELAKQSADLAESQFALIKAQNAFGTATTQDLLTASVTAATAEVRYGMARNDYLVAELNLETAMGL